MKIKTPLYYQRIRNERIEKKLVESSHNLPNEAGRRLSKLDFDEFVNGHNIGYKKQSSLKGRHNSHTRHFIQGYSMGLHTRIAHDNYSQENLKSPNHYAKQNFALYVGVRDGIKGHEHNVRRAPKGHSHPYTKGYEIGQKNKDVTESAEDVADDNQLYNDDYDDDGDNGFNYTEDIVRGLLTA